MKTKTYTYNYAVKIEIRGRPTVARLITELFRRDRRRTRREDPWSLVFSRARNNDVDRVVVHVANARDVYKLYNLCAFQRGTRLIVRSYVSTLGRWWISTFALVAVAAARREPPTPPPKTYPPTGRIRSITQTDTRGRSVRAGVHERTFPFRLTRMERRDVWQAARQTAFVY